MKKVITVVLLTILFILIFISITYSESLTVQYVSKNCDSSNLNVFIKINGTISYNNIDAIRNGINTSFYMYVQLLSVGGLFGIGQKIMEEKVYTFVISYDVWENAFIIKDKKSKEVSQVKNPKDIIQYINKAINPFSASLSSINKKSKIFLRTKIKIQTIKLFPPFGIFLYFFDPWNYESDWIKSDDFILEKL